MKHKSIINEYKDGSSLTKLNIVSNLTTIFTGVIAIITSQIFTYSFFFDELLPIRIAFYLMTLGLSLFLTYLLIKAVSIFISEFKSFLVKTALTFFLVGAYIFFNYLFWTFTLEVF